MENRLFQTIHAAFLNEMNTALLCTSILKHFISKEPQCLYVWILRGKKKVKCAVNGKCCKVFVINPVHMKIIMREV